MPKKIRELKGMLSRAGWILIEGGKGSHSKWMPDVLSFLERMGMMPSRIRKRMLLVPSAKRADEKEIRVKKNRNAVISRYSVIIQWSDEDQGYVVTLPEWGGCHTHGATYEEAAKNAREVLEMLIEGEEKDGRELPPPHQFMYPGPSGFTYELNHLAPVGNRRAIA